MRISNCVGCGMTVLGETPRCPGCQDEFALHLAEIAEVPEHEAPVVRGPFSILFTWLVAAEAIAAVVLGTMLAMGKC